ncbi:hypothetical protein [Bradyrhizobium embrapense]
MTEAEVEFLTALVGRVTALENEVRELKMWSGKDQTTAAIPQRAPGFDYSARLAMPKVALREMTHANVPLGDIVGDGRRRSPVQRD